MIDIIEIAKKHNLKIIEDSCQAFGAEYFGKKIGSFGDIACFSFFPTKNLGCAGDGGMIATNDDSISIICRALRSHGSGKFGLQAYEILSEFKNCNLDKEITILDDSGSKYYNFLVGYNSRLDTIQAAMLLVKLNYIDLWNNMRAEHAAYYNYNLKDSNFILPKVPLGCKHVYHMYVIQSTNRDKLIQHLNEMGISAGVYYPVPLHLQKVYRILGYNVGDNPISELLAKRTLAIPIYPELTKNQLDYIVNALLSFK
ncbi:dTDP-4-amino-4,6-dideoxygalactose transaminase [Clostridium punense]|uniref:dTDP-4-amino-4,6-dideoxygalactose transaminase n=1 Tax=Clostridium punense TaxID=1054297 RepID=A0ABS4K8A9_9CLOT|nr:hypothetical protein M918_19675 [Clostridium sp. BL8]MBP2024018.1 dTDP-4-amino-4,6-dideoxygalactose transaminase [Clostridium punense]